MTDREMYLARAAAARSEADAATLDNVKDRCLRSEAAWTEMALRAERTERMRATQLAEKAAAATAAATALPTRNDKTSNDSEQVQILAPAESREAQHRG